MFSLREYREPKHRLPHYLPWAFLEAPGVVRQKTGALQKTVAFRGPDLASSLDSTLISASARINNALRRLGSGWSVFVEAQRFQSRDYPTCTWSHPTAWIVDEERRRHYQQEGTHYESNYYLTFCWMPPPPRARRFLSLFFDNAGNDNSGEADRRDLEYFTRMVREITDILRGVFPAVGELDDEQTLTYLHSTISTNRHPVCVPETPMYLDAVLPDLAFSPGDVPMLGDHYIQTCTISGFPGATQPGILDSLNHLGCEYRWVTRFICMDKLEAEGVIKKIQRQWQAKVKTLWQLLKEEASKEPSRLVDNSAANKAADADAALQELGDDQCSFGYLTTTITVWDHDFDAVRAKAQNVKKVIQSRGFTVREETLHGLHAWLSSLPGHNNAGVRRPIVSTLNLAHTMPLSAVWAGDDENEHLKKVTGCGAPHIYCSTRGCTPYRTHLAVGDVGHTLILGPTGAGKSTLLGTLALGWLKYPGARVIIFDKDRSARASTLAVGGTCYEPGNDSGAVAFQPLRNIDDPGERVWASQFITTLLTAQGVKIDHELQPAIDATLAGLASVPNPKRRTVTHFVTGVKSHSRLLGEALRPYTLDGNYGQIFDADHDDVNDVAWTMFEMGHLMNMGPAVIIPALEYLFHRVESQLDGRATLMIVDEAWLFLGHPVFAGRLQAWLKTLRKKNVYVVFATQEVADALHRPELMSTILSACHTKIFLPDEEALAPAMMEAYERIGLTSAEIQVLAHAQKKRDYFLKTARGSCLFQLELGKAALAFVGMASEQDQRFLDEMVKTQSREQYATAMLERAGVHWAVEALHGREVA